MAFKYKTGDRVPLPKMQVDPDGDYYDYEGIPVMLEVPAQDAVVVGCTRTRYPHRVATYVRLKVRIPNWPSMPEDYSLEFSLEEIKSGFTNYRDIVSSPESAPQPDHAHRLAQAQADAINGYLGLPLALAFNAQQMIWLAQYHRDMPDDITLDELIEVAEPHASDFGEEA